MPRHLFLVLLTCSITASAVAAVPDNRFGPDDLARLADVAGPEFSPDGAFIVYSVTTTDRAEDAQQSDLWRVRFDGSDRVQLTRTGKHDEWAPAWSPDGRSIAFLTDRGEDEDATTQVWMLPAGGGEAQQVTSLAGGVEEFAWSPDGRKLALIAYDPERAAGTPRPRNPLPIVTERFQFKQDVTGYLGTRRKHLYLYDIERRHAELLTPGDHDEQLPAWSPDGRSIAYVTRRGADADRHGNFDLHVIESLAGANERRLTTFAGMDNDPDAESRPA
jgi:Tol biopolymer transport system component